MAINIEKVISILICLMMALNMSAQDDEYNKLLPSSYEYKDNNVKYIKGNVPYMFEEIIKTSLDYADAIYLPRKVKYDENGKKLKEPIIMGNSFQIFLAKCKRDTNWEDRSLAYFCESFNEYSTGIVTCSGDCEKTNYEFVIKVLEVYKNGKIKVNILLKDAKTGETLCVLECVSSDCDDDDEITLRDQMKSIGSLMGTAMKNIQKHNAKQMRKNVKNIQSQK